MIYNQKFIKLAIGALIWGSFLGASEAEVDYDVSTIVEKANHAAYYQGKNGKSHVCMTITDKYGQNREREFIVLRSDGVLDGDQKYFVYFNKPTDVRKMVFMVHKYTAVNKNDDRWLYLPNLDLVKRIAATDKRTSFVGSDFFYEDISGRNLADDDHQLQEVNEQHYVIRNTPKDSGSVEFSYYDIYIDKDSFIPMCIKYFDKSETRNLYREIKAEKVENISAQENGSAVYYPTVTESIAKDYTNGSSTKMIFSDIKYNIELGDIFTERYLKRPPREVMR